MQREPSYASHVAPKADSGIDRSIEEVRFRLGEDREGTLACELGEESPGYNTFRPGAVERLRIGFPKPTP